MVEYPNAEDALAEIARKEAEAFTILLRQGRASGPGS
jgi:hypothetical protein